MHMVVGGTSRSQGTGNDLLPQQTNPTSTRSSFARGSTRSQEVSESEMLFIPPPSVADLHIGERPAESMIDPQSAHLSLPRAVVNPYVDITTEDPLRLSLRNYQEPPLRLPPEIVNPYEEIAIETSPINAMVDPQVVPLSLPQETATPYTVIMSNTTIRNRTLEIRSRAIEIVKNNSGKDCLILMLVVASCAAYATFYLQYPEIYSTLPKSLKLAMGSHILAGGGLTLGLLLDGVSLVLRKLCCCGDNFLIDNLDYCIGILIVYSLRLSWVVSFLTGIPLWWWHRALMVTLPESALWGVRLSLALSVIFCCSPSQFR